MIACDVAGVSVATRHADVNVHLSQEPSYVNGEIWDEFKSQLDDVARHLQSLRSRVSSLSRAHAQFWDESEAVLPNGSNILARFDIKRCVRGNCCWSLSLHAPIQQESVDTVFTLGRSRLFCQF